MTKDQTARTEKLNDLMDLMGRAEVDGALMPAEDRKRLSRLLTDLMIKIDVDRFIGIYSADDPGRLPGRTSLQG